MTNQSSKLNYSFFTKEPSKRNPERINELVELRGKELHKASSVRYRQTKDRYKDLTAPVRSKKIEAHRNKANEYFKLLIDELVEQFPDQRPLPAQGLEYNGKTYKLQSYDGHNARYIEESLFREDQYYFTQESYRSHLVRHFLPGSA